MKYVMHVPFNVEGILKIGWFYLVNQRPTGAVDSLNPDSLKISDSKQETFFMKIAIRSAMQNDFGVDLGKVNYCMTQRGDKKLITIPISDNYTLLVMIQNNVNHETIINNILNEIACSN